MSEDAALISRYLLHDLPPDEQEAIERRYFSEPDYLELVEAVEGDLINAYVRGELPREQRARFEMYFLRGRARRERVRMAEALHARLRRPDGRRSTSAADRRTVRPRLLAAAAVLIVAVGLATWMWPRAEAPVVVVQRRVPVPPPVTITATLMPGLTRDAATPRTIALAREVEQVQFRAVIDVEGNWRDLRASLRTSEGREVWSDTGLTLAADGTVTMLIPAARLQSGEHVLVVSSADEVLGDYPFVVERRSPPADRRRPGG